MIVVNASHTFFAFVEYKVSGIIPDPLPWCIKSSSSLYNLLHPKFLFLFISPKKWFLSNFPNTIYLSGSQNDGSIVWLPKQPFGPAAVISFFSLNSKYETYLFRKDKPSTFQLPDHSLFTGIIRGVTASGKLQLQTEDALKTYGLKELSLLY